MFTPVDPKVNFPRLEERILEFWQRNAIFTRSVEREPKAGLPNGGLFVFYEGPPTANARPGIHHVLSRVFKDLIPRYKTMQGYRVPRKAGWDTHGLPVELEIEKELGLKSKPEIEAYGIAAFNAKCKESVSRYVEEWTRLSERIGYWCDLENPYVTWHNSYIETCWWIFKQMWDHGLVYQDYRVAPYCARCGTTLSDHEVSLGYEEDTPDPSVFPKFRVLSSEFSAATGIATSGYDTVSLVAWTTTPWTLPGNTALAIKEDAEYSVIERGPANARELVLVATRLVPQVFDTELGISLLQKPAPPTEVVAECRAAGNRIERVRVPGSALVGLKYEPLYRPELNGQPVMRFDDDGRLRPVTDVARTDGLRRVIAADYVSLEDGSGIVHTAPAFGGEDFEQGKLFKLLFVQPIDLRGQMAAGLPGEGKFAKQADRDVIRDLEERGLMLKHGTIKHTYPFCWRCSTPLLYYAKPSWYIRTTKQKEQLIAGNSQINWYPEHIKTGRFGNWLENNIDWAFSRERYWGTPLPFWKCEACNHAMCVGSKAELVEMAADPAKAEAMDDFHRPYIDDILLTCEKCGGSAKRVPEVADAWFDSGAMPYAQWHYPFENEDEFLKHFPADFICEAIDQTRGWFYTLHAEATMLKASEAVPEGISFKNVIVLGHIQDEKGAKMSKSKGNAVEPWSVLDAHGADATRWYMYSASPAGSSRRFSSGLVEEGLRRFLLTLWNTYSFFVSYANIDGFADLSKIQNPKSKMPEIDRWLLSELNALILKVTNELEAYDPTDASRAIEAFVDDLSNWYVRRSRRRFWRGVSESDTDKQSAYYTLYTALKTVSLLLAPFTPFVAEELWQNLVRSIDKDAPESVHLASWPLLIPLDPGNVSARDTWRREPLTYIHDDPIETHDPSPDFVDANLNRRMQDVKKVCSLGRAVRAKAGLKVRQPIASVFVKSRGVGARVLFRHHSAIILEELNAKHLVLLDEMDAPHIPAEDKAPLSSVATVTLRPNLAVLGKRLGAQLPSVRQRLAELDPFELLEMASRGKPVTIDDVQIEPGELLFDAAGIGDHTAVMESGFIVAISTAITPELADEGLAREVVRRVQDMRREAGFELSDRITLWYAGPGGSPADADVARVMGSQAAYIQGETLATEMVAGEPPADAHRADQDLEGTKLVLAVRRV